MEGPTGIYRGHLRTEIGRLGNTVTVTTFKVYASGPRSADRHGLGTEPSSNHFTGTQRVIGNGRAGIDDGAAAGEDNLRPCHRRACSADGAGVLGRGLWPRDPGRMAAREFPLRADAEPRCARARRDDLPLLFFDVVSAPSSCGSRSRWSRCSRSTPSSIRTIPNNALSRHSAEMPCAD